MNYKIFEDYLDYRVYENGDVFNVKKNKVMTKYDDGRGYLFVSLFKNGKQRNIKVARLMGLLFIDNPENKPTVDHINNDRGDNRLINLKWATRKEQAHNRRLTTNNTSGFKGVYPENRSTGIRWIASLKAHGTLRRRCCNTKEEAIIKRRELEIEYLGRDYIV
mgnify:CR=1 FL=1|tara:strand:+ start:653 stop:1141 length:489 start_codon:yes stop_codon:yes gene_type:complete